MHWPADIFVPNFSLWKDLVLDVAVTCPLQHKHLLEAAQTAGFTCNDNAEQIKIKTIREELKGKVSATSLLFLNYVEVSHAISLIFYSN